MKLTCGICHGRGELTEFGESWPCPLCLDAEEKAFLEVEEEKFAREYEEIRRGEIRRKMEEEIGLDIED